MATLEQMYSELDMSTAPISDEIAAELYHDQLVYLKIIDADKVDYGRLKKLQTIVLKDLEERQNKVRLQAMKDIMTGKIKSLEEIPLFRKPNPDGSSYITNIPKDLLNYFGFMAYINEMLQNRK